LLRVIIISSLMCWPDLFRKPVERNNTSVYNVLSRFVKREALRKIGGTYFHPPTDEIENSGPDEETAV